MNGVEIGNEVRATEALTIPPHIRRQHAINSEYVIICQHPIDGLYIIPSAADQTQWLAICFIRRGSYAGAILRFTLNLPADFPDTEELPSIIFDLPIFHPNIDPVSHRMDLSRYFPEGWKSGRHHITHLLHATVRSFFATEFDVNHAVNAEAAKLFQTDRERSRARVAESVKQSRSVVYDPPSIDDSNAIRFTPWDSSIHEPLRQKLLIGEQGSDDRSIAKGMSWVDPELMTYMTEFNADLIDSGVEANGFDDGQMNGSIDLKLDEI